MGDCELPRTFPNFVVMRNVPLDPGSQDPKFLLVCPYRVQIRNVKTVPVSIIGYQITDCPRK